MGNSQPLNLPQSWVINNQESKEGFLVLDYSPVLQDGQLVVHQRQINPLPAVSVKDYLRLAKLAKTEKKLAIIIRSKAIGDDLLAYLLTQHSEINVAASKDFLKNFLPSEYKNGKFVQKDGIISFVVEGDYDKFMEGDKETFQSKLSEGIVNAIKEITKENEQLSKLVSQHSKQIPDEEQQRIDAIRGVKQSQSENLQNVLNDKCEEVPKINLLEAIEYERGSIRIIFKQLSAYIIAYVSKVCLFVERVFHYYILNEKLVRDRNGYYYFKCK